MKANTKRLAAIATALAFAAGAAVSVCQLRPANQHQSRLELLPSSGGIGRTAVLTMAPETEPETETAAPGIEPAPELQSLGTFKLTAYCPCAKCCGEWADGITYTGTVATPGRTVAVDPDVIPLGSTIYINGRAYVAEDIGGAIQGNRIDVFFATHQDALDFGVQYADIKIQ